MLKNSFFNWEKKEKIKLYLLKYCKGTYVFFYMERLKIDVYFLDANANFPIFRKDRLRVWKLSSFHINNISYFKCFNNFIFSILTFTPHFPLTFIYRAIYNIIKNYHRSKYIAMQIAMRWASYQLVRSAIIRVCFLQWCNSCSKRIVLPF